MGEAGFQNTRVIRRRKTSNESSYWADFHDKNEESPLGNPDLVNDEVDVWPDRWNTDHKAILEALDGVDFKKLLTDNEAKALTKFVIESKSQPQIGVEMGISRQRVSKLMKSASSKIKRFLKINE